MSAGDAPKRKRGSYRRKASSRNPNALLPPDPKAQQGALYRKEYAVLARRLCVYLGATSEELAKVIGVSKDRIYIWAKQHQDFAEALTLGRMEADGVVAERLFMRATGWTHKTTKLFQYEGKILSKTITENFPPDTMAGIYWLNNRRPLDWRRRMREDDEAPAGGNTTIGTLTQIRIEALSAEERQQLRGLLTRALPAADGGDPPGS